MRADTPSVLPPWPATGCALLQCLVAPLGHPSNKKGSAVSEGAPPPVWRGPLCDE